MNAPLSARTGNPPVEAALTAQALIATEGLFEDSGLVCSPLSGPAKLGYGLIAVVGFSGDGVRGSIVLSMNLEAVLATLPAGVETEPADWVAELSNQLLGRMVNRMVREGLDLRMATPVVLSGAELRIEEAADQHVVAWQLEKGDARAVVTLQDRIHPSVELTPVEYEQEVPDEGEFLLF